jgi:hypothetical protein
LSDCTKYLRGRRSNRDRRVNRRSNAGVNGVDTDIPVENHILRKNSMNKLLMTLCAFAFAATAFAQGTAPGTPPAPAPKAAEPAKAEAPMKADSSMKSDSSKMAATDTGKATKKTTHKKKSTKHKTTSGSTPPATMDKAPK